MAITTIAPPNTAVNFSTETPLSDVSTWANLAAGNTGSVPDFLSENCAPSAVNDAFRELQAALRRQLENGQWFDWGLTHTRLTSADFSLSGDYRTLYEVGRRVKMSGSADAYGTVSAVSYSAPDTTVTVAENNVPGALSSVAVSILSPTNGAVPAVFNHGPMDFTGGRVRARSGTAHTTGAGVELAYTGGEGYVQAYDRGTSTYKNLNLDGLGVYSYVGGTAYFSVTPAGANSLFGQAIYAYRADNNYATRLYHDITGGHIVAGLGTLELSATSLNITGSTTTSTASTGDGGALPALPKGYLQIQINGTPVKIPYYLT